MDNFLLIRPDPYLEHFLYFVFLDDFLSRNVRDLVGGGEVEGRNLWSLLRRELNPQEQQRFMLLTNINTDLGRGRAWIRYTQLQPRFLAQSGLFCRNLY